MTILEKIKFEEDWLSEVNLTKENIKIAFAGIRATALEQQPCEDCISRADVLALAEKGTLVSNGNYKSVCKAINELPSVTPQPKTGKWIFHKPFDNGHKNCNECIECSQCHTWFGHDCYEKTPYCPNCGAKMEEVEG